MKTTLAVFGAAALALGLAGCSTNSPRQPLQASGNVTVNGVDGSADPVNCHREGSVTMISTGTDETGTRSVISNAGGLGVKSVEIHNLGGFAGSYQQDLQGQANVEMNGRTMVLTGEAAGFTTERPHQRSLTPFTIRVTC